MSITTAVILQQAAQWPQGDIRDPIGVWGAKWIVLGDASGDEIEVTINTPLGAAAAFVYTLYDVNIEHSAGALVSNALMMQWFTGWPDVEAAAGVEAAHTNVVGVIQGDAGLGSAPIGAINANGPLWRSEQRFLLSFDPRFGHQSSRTLAIIKLVNIGVGTNYTGFLYGYYWDRSVMNAPGGPRHPGG